MMHTEPLRGYLTPDTGTKKVDLLACPSAKDGLATSHSHSGGVVTDTNTFSAYCHAFGHSDYVPGGATPWYGWTANNSTPDSDLRSKCPRLSMLGRTVDGYYIASPSKQAMSGDISSTTGLITCWDENAGDLPMSHSVGSNVAFMDGHLEWVPIGDFKHYITYYASNCRIYWK